MTMGIPRLIKADQGSEFNNKLNSEKLKIRHVLMIAFVYIYHPQVKVIQLRLVISIMSL